MPKACDPNLPEHLKGIGACQIGWEVKRRSGNPNWWCRTHELNASAPDGGRLERCPGSWFDAVPLDRQLDLDMADGEVSLWGALSPAIQVGAPPIDVGGVHVHRRPTSQALKDIDASFDIVRLRHEGRELVIESMAAAAYSIAELAGREVSALRCPKPGCGGFHTDEQKFATHPHVKHLCNRCGRNFRERIASVSNPLAAAYELLALPRPPAPVDVERRLDLTVADYAAIAIWPSNRAILTTLRRPQEIGIHVHAWDIEHRLVIDDTYSPVFIDGQTLDPASLRLLAVQRALAHETPILSMACVGCGTSLMSPTSGWIEPLTRHECPICGTVNQTRRRVFLNPLSGKISG